MYSSRYSSHEFANPFSKSRQVQYDFNGLQDRYYENVLSTNDDGWLVGGGEGPAAYKLAAPDSAHQEVKGVSELSLCVFWLPCDNRCISKKKNLCPLSLSNLFVALVITFNNQIVRLGTFEEAWGGVALETVIDFMTNGRYFKDRVRLFLPLSVYYVYIPILVGTTV